MKWLSEQLLEISTCLLRLHSKVSRLTLKTRAKLETLKARRSCAKSFWRFAAQLLDEHKSDTSSTFNANEAESFYRRVYSSEPKEFEQPAWLPTPPSPATPFNEELISIDEIQQAISNNKLWSTPSPRDQVPYMVLKRCPSLTAALLDLFNACWSSRLVPAAWKVGVIRLIPQGSVDEDPRNSSNFRPIALTPCIGKLFTTILKNRWL